MLPRTKRSYGVRPVVRVRTREAAVHTFSQSPHHRERRAYFAWLANFRNFAPKLFLHTIPVRLWAPLRRRRPADPHVVTRVPVRDAQLSRLMGDDH